MHRPWARSRWMFSLLVPPETASIHCKRANTHNVHTRMYTHTHTHTVHKRWSLSPNLPYRTGCGNCRRDVGTLAGNKKKTQLASLPATPASPEAPRSQGEGGLRSQPLRGCVHPPRIASSLYYYFFDRREFAETGIPDRRSIRRTILFRLG